MRLSLTAEEERGGPQLIPRPPTARPGRPAPWAVLPAGERRVDLARVRSALAAAPAPSPPPPGIATSRAAAVLVPLFDEEEVAWVVLTRRAKHLRAHKGEVSFPGGRQEEGETLEQTALREAAEEIALDPRTVKLLGELDHLSTVSSAASIVPFVGALPGRPSGLVPDPDEVEHILLVPLADLLGEGVYHEEVWWREGLARPVHFFDLVGDTIWGATAAMLRQLLSLALGVKELRP